MQKVFFEKNPFVINYFNIISFKIILKWNVKYLMCFSVFLILHPFVYLWEEKFKNGKNKKIFSLGKICVDEN